MNSNFIMSDAVPKKKRKKGLCLRELSHRLEAVKKHRNKIVLSSMTDGGFCSHILPASHS